MVRRVLEYYGAVLPAPRGDKWVPMRCPFHGDEQASAAINEVADKFICHGCMPKAEDAVGLIMWWEECGYRQAVERCAGIAGTSVAPVRSRPLGPAGLADLFN